MNDLEKIRNEYLQKSLSKADVCDDPINQFETWFTEAAQSDVAELTACTLSTCSSSGRPSGRIVLLKGFSNDGFVFYTNYESRKGLELIRNPFAALTFFWKELERQVRIEGKALKVAPGESDNYFKSRPMGSKLGAWASPQSRVLSSRAELEEAEVHYGTTFGENIPRPAHWGGFRLIPDQIEFWQGRANRLHDRILFSSQQDKWKIERLAP